MRDFLATIVAGGLVLSLVISSICTLTTLMVWTDIRAQEYLCDGSPAKRIEYIIPARIVACWMVEEVQ